MNQKLDKVDPKGVLESFKLFNTVNMLNSSKGVSDLQV